MVKETNEQASRVCKKLTTLIVSGFVDDEELHVDVGSLRLLNDERTYEIVLMGDTQLLRVEFTPKQYGMLLSAMENALIETHQHPDADAWVHASNRKESE